MKTRTLDRDAVLAAVRDARRVTLSWSEDLSDAQWLGPRQRNVAPLRWELGHVAWYHERWFLRCRGPWDPIVPDADQRFDPAVAPHHARWDLSFPERAATLAYLDSVQKAVLELLEADAMEEDLTLAWFAVLYEDQRAENLALLRQWHGWARPRATEHLPPGSPFQAGALSGDADVPSGRYRIGAEPMGGPCIDNEKWSHEVRLKPFRIAKTPVTQSEFAAFVDAGGYGNRALWDADGWRWKGNAQAMAPLYWRRASLEAPWQRRDFEKWVDLEAHRPMVHVSWHEARAYCRFAGRRLPTEEEWEVAATAEPKKSDRRVYPWGDDPPERFRANVDGRVPTCADVAAFSDGDSAFGCRQMIGNVWEWTDSTFDPYPGFAPDADRGRSQGNFGSTRVMRGGSFATRSRGLRGTRRGFDDPARREAFVGFRTVAL